jgi:hypothetical protein
MGQLTFSHWVLVILKLTIIEIIVDANPNDVTLSASSKVLRPLDKQPNCKYFITPIGASSYQILDGGSLNVIKAVVNNEATERGFFQGRLIKL